jgi:hypothetical protein
MLIRAAGAVGIDYTTFQDEFDLDINLGSGQSEPRNNFGSVRDAVQAKYPHVRFEETSFPTGAEKIAFIDARLAKHQPVLVSIRQVESGQPRGWHVMPVVDATDDSYLLLDVVHRDGTPRTRWMTKREVEHIHDNFEGGKEVAFLADVDRTQEA